MDTFWTLLDALDTFWTLFILNCRKFWKRFFNLTFIVYGKKKTYLSKGHTGPACTWPKRSVWRVSAFFAGRLSRNHGVNPTGCGLNKWLRYKKRARLKQFLPENGQVNAWKVFRGEVLYLTTRIWLNRHRVFRKFKRKTGLERDWNCWSHEKKNREETLFCCHFTNQALLDFFRWRFFLVNGLVVIKVVFLTPTSWQQEKNVP